MIDKCSRFADSIILNSITAEYTIFLIHGYSGTPEDFNKLPNILQNKCNVKIIIHLLPGHATSIDDLNNISFEDFLCYIENQLKKELDLNKKIIIGGLSFGALIAIILAIKYPVYGIINISNPYILNFPFTLPGLKHICFKKHWQKKFSKEEVKLRHGLFYHQKIHINGLFFVKKATNAIKNTISTIDCPIISIHSTNDPISSINSVKQLDKKIKSRHKIKIFNNKNHNIFFSNNRHKAYKSIISFVNNIQKPQNIKTYNKVAAIIPAYNEEKHILSVVNTLINTPIVDEIIVIDDGSTDNTANILKNIENITILINEKNYGKSYSIERGINNTNADILFFCDADLQDFTPEIATKIIEPVINRQKDMFIGIRNNISQKALTLFAINSGERTLRRKLWETMPNYFKHRYRLEVGLNITAYKYGNGYGYQKFPYYQTLKEVKYGIFKGTFLRWWMNIDVLYAYILAIFILFFMAKNKK